MSLYFILNTDDYKGEQKQIGDIMQVFTNVLYKSTGLSLGTYVGPTSEELSNFSQHKIWNMLQKKCCGKILLMKKRLTRCLNI